MSCCPIAGATGHLNCNVISPLPTFPKFDFNAGWQELFETYKSLIPTLSPLVEDQYAAFRSNQAPTIADERITSILIQENNEELVNLKLIAHPCISMLPDPKKPFEGALYNSGLPSASKMRKSVFSKLERMIEELDNLAPLFGYKSGQINIRVFESLRDLTTQAMIFKAQFDEIQKKYPEMSAEDVEMETAKWVSPVKNNVPVHSTGAAVDIRLWDNEANDFLDVGPFGVIWGPAEAAPTFSESAALSIQQKANRLFVSQPRISLV